MKKCLLIVAVGLMSVASVFAQTASWQGASSGGIPSLATPVGHTPDGTVLYLVRSGQTGTTIGYVNPSSQMTTLYPDQQTAGASSYEVYMGGDRWVAASAGKMPANVLSAGSDSNGSPVDILRISYKGWVIPAYYSANDQAAVAYVNGNRKLFTTFQALVPAWVGASSPGAVDQGFRAAVDSDGNALTPLRSPRGSGIQLGKFNVGTRKGYFSYGGKEINVDLGNAQVFVGKGVWRHWNGNLPAGAIPAGRDDDGSLLYMIRASVPGVPGAQSVGKYTDARKQAYVPYGGNEVPVTDFDILSYDLNAPGLAPSAPVQPVSQPTASDSEAPSVPTAINTQYGYWRIHEQFGPANVGPDGKYSAVFTYDAVSGEKVKISTLGTTLTLISPDGTKIDAPPAPTRTIQTKLRTTGTYTIEISSASPEWFYMTLVGRGYEFRGNIDSRSPVRSDGRRYAQFELSGLPQQPSGTGKAVYQIDAISRDFQPVILSVWEKETGKRLPLLSEQKDNLREIAFFVNPPSGRIEVRVGAAGGSFPNGQFRSTVAFSHFDYSTPGSGGGH